MRSNRHLKLLAPRRLVLVAVFVLACSIVGSASALTPSFSAFISTAAIWSYSTPNQLDVRAYASYRDYECTPSYNCDRNVLAEFELRRGYSSYGPIMARAYDETGQYGSTLRASFKLPPCRFIPRYRSQSYTITMTAIAPDGLEKTSRRWVSQRSCQR